MWWQQSNGMQNCFCNCNVFATPNVKAFWEFDPWCLSIKDMLNNSLGDWKTKLTSDAHVSKLCSCALPSGLAPLPHIFLSFPPSKPRLSRSLKYLGMKLSLRAYHFAIGDRSVVSLSSTASFMVLHPLPSPCSPPLPPDICRTHGPPAIPSSWNCLNPEPLLTSTHLFLFFPTYRTEFHTLFNRILPCRSSRQLFNTISSLCYVVP